MDTATSELSEVLARLAPYEERGRTLADRMRALVCGLDRHARLGPTGPLMVLLFGGANTGKSSLFNAFAGRDVSIAHAIAGSTRHLLMLAAPAVNETLSDPTLWPAPYRPMRLERKEQLEEEIVPRRIYLTDGAPDERRILVDSPDITTAHRENAALSTQALILTDVVVLVLTEEQHADRVLIEKFPAIRDLAKHPIVLFNRVSNTAPEEHGSYQKFRTLWLENRMGGLPERFFIPRLAPVRVTTQLEKNSVFNAFRAHLDGLDVRNLRESTQAGVVVALRKAGRELVGELGQERGKLVRTREELSRRYTALVKEYNSRRRWASRTLQVRSWLQSAIGSISPTIAPAAAAAAEHTQRRFWQLILTPLMGQDDRPTALEGLELMADALESDPNPAPFYRPFSRMTAGFTSLIFGKPVVGRDGDPPALTDALDLLERARCAFVVHEDLPATLGPDWRTVLPVSDQPAVEPRTALDGIAEEYREMCEELKRQIREIIARDPEVRSRLSKRHAGLALTAGMTIALALIDMGFTGLAVGVGLGTPVLWELMDWAVSQPDLNTALYAFEFKKSRWLEHAFQRHVTGPLWDALAEREKNLDPAPLEMALRHSGLGDLRCVTS